MARGHNVVRQLAGQSRPSTSLCHSCLSALRTRLASTAASPIETGPIEPSPTGRAAAPLTSSQSHSTKYRIKASVLLSRPPVLTRTLTPFEKSYFLYQRRLNERLALPFTRYFYYQKGTPGDVEWKRKIKERKTPARDIGAYNAYSNEGWNDELLVGSSISEPEEQVERLLKDAEVEVKEQDLQAGGEVVKREEVEKPMPRMTEADREGDLKSLNRSLERTLYLVVKGKEGGWTFPGAVLEKKESLHTGAERIIVQTGGVNMNTWVVGNMPIGHQIYNYSQAIIDRDQGIELRGEKNFFMKARIMAGQASLKDNELGVEDFRWLAREEIQSDFHERDWSAVKNILPER
ncbi:large subunit ribosomal protein L46, partial [Lecanoromycetidae sp. Uapishka_2]